MSDQKAMSRSALQMWASEHSVEPQEIFAPSYQNHQEPDAEGGLSTKNLSQWQELVASHHHAFSDCEVCIFTQIAEDNLVSTRWEITATHSGEYMGLAPTGKRISWRGVEIDRFDGGKIVESWVVWNKYVLFAQLGLVG